MKSKNVNFRFKSIKVHVDDAGVERVSFKDICDSIGLNYRGQKMKALNNAHYFNKLGMAFAPPIKPKNALHVPLRSIYMIRLDRVDIFYRSVNPTQVDAQGNAKTAQWLRNSQHEWIDALGEYLNRKKTSATIIQFKRANKKNDQILSEAQASNLRTIMELTRTLPISYASKMVQCITDAQSDAESSAIGKAT